MTAEKADKHSKGRKKNWAYCLRGPADPDEHGNAPRTSRTVAGRDPVG